MKNPLVSVIIPVYNYERYIAGAIESVTAQSFTNWELIVVDDYSSDGTPEIIDSYADGEKIRFLRNERNLGQFPTHNRGAALAKGRYIKFLHGDDIMYPHCLEMMVTLMEAFPTAGLGISHDPWPWLAPKLFSSRDAWHLHMAGKSSLLSHGPSGTIFRADAFRKVGGFDERYHSADFKMNLEIAMRFPILLLPYGLWWYRYHDQQVLTYMTANDIGTKEYIVWYRELLNMTENPLRESERMTENQRTIRDFLRVCLHHLKHGRIRRAWNVWRAPKLSFRTWLTLLQRTPSVAQPNFQKSDKPDWSTYRDRLSKQNIAYRPKNPTNKTIVERNIYERERFECQERDASSKGLLLTDNYPELTKTPLVSILIPAFNTENTVEDAIQSVMAQRFDDWEIVLVDDASTDRTYTIAKSYADGKRIKCFRNDNRLGKWQNHNRCADLASGKYLKFLHSDDLIYPHCLELMTHMMKKSGAALGVSIGNINLPAGTVLNPEETWRQEFRGYSILQEGPTPSIYRKEYFNEVGGFNSQHEPACRHLALRITVLGGCVIMPATLYWVSRNANIRPRIAPAWEQGELQGGRWLRTMLESENCPLSPENRNIVIKGLLGGAFRLVLQALFRADPITAWSIYREHNLSITDFRFVFFKKPWLSIQALRAAHSKTFPSDLSLFSS
jgi:glycosyltransferase involved in cell wall biosynthesis